MVSEEIKNKIIKKYKTSKYKYLDLNEDGQIVAFIDDAHKAKFRKE